MPNPRLLAVITALMMIAGAPGAQAAYTSGQLAQIEQLVLAKSWGQLKTYILANPALLEGDDALAQELKAFMADTQGGALSTIFAASLEATLVSIRSTY